MARKKKESIENINYDPVDAPGFENGIRHRLCPRLDKELIAWGDMFVNWCKNDLEAFSTEYFLAEHNIDSAVWYAWIARCPEFAKRIERGRRFIFKRREKGAIKGDYAPAVIMPYLHMWSEDYKKAAEWRAELNKKADVNKVEKITIEYQPFGKSEDNE